MQLKEFSFICPIIESAAVFKAIETVISPDVIAQTLGNTDSFEERKRKLPSQLVVCLVIAMSLWSSDAMGTVLKNRCLWFSSPVDKTGTVLESPKQLIN